jgi:cell division protein FtsQ
MCGATAMLARSVLLHDERFFIPSSSSIELQGNTHVTRSQLMGVFGEDVERNIFSVDLAQRRAELERLPWVAHATVMRLLPNRMRVSVVERTPVAFVRQGNHIGLVDANGVLLDMPVDAKSREHYSFPVVTGISGNDPVSTRAARMKIFGRFTSELDGAGEKTPGEKISQELSEVDLSNPEDVQALIPDHSTEILVHFGEDNFLERYRRFKEHLPEWRTLYPKLSSVDMRYEQQVVLQMPQGSGGQMTPSASAASGDANALKAASPGVAEDSAETQAVKPEAKAGDRVTLKPAAKAPTAAVTHGAAMKSVAKPAHGSAHHDVASAVPAKKSAPKSKAHAAPPKHHPVVTKHPAGTTQHHPTQVAHP